MGTHTSTFPDLLRGWRRRRALSQLALAAEAGVSQRHLSFIESGRSRPSRDMVLRLAEHLAVPLRERNAMLLAAGFAPAWRERPVDDPALAAARRAVTRVLAAHEPYPALAVDRHWRLIEANAAVPPLLVGADPALLRPPVDVLRLSLHPAGLGPRIANWRDWRAHVLARLARQAEATADAALLALRDELRALPAPPDAAPPGGHAVTGGEIAVPLRLRTAEGVLSFLSTTTVFSTAQDVGLAELVIESFLPADEATAEALRRSRS